jgi:hypothetical protein
LYSVIGRTDKETLEHEKYQNELPGQSDSKALGRYIPALTPTDPAFFSPFFFTMKLAPMKILDESARINPVTLSEDMPGEKLGFSSNSAI